MDTLPPRCLKPLFQSEATCEPSGMKMIFFYTNETHFQDTKVFPGSLA